MPPGWIEFTRIPCGPSSSGRLCHPAHRPFRGRVGDGSRDSDHPGNGGDVHNGAPAGLGNRGGGFPHP